MEFGRSAKRARAVDRAEAHRHARGVFTTPSQTGQPASPTLARTTLTSTGDGGPNVPPASEGWGGESVKSLAEESILGLVEALSYTGQANVVLNRAGRVQFATAAAHNLFDADFGMRSGFLTCSDPQSQAHLSRIAQLASGSGMEDLVSFAIRSPAQIRPIVARPRHLRTPAGAALPDLRIVLTLVSLRTDDAVSREDLRRLFLLSAAEADVAALIAQGFSVAEVAASRNVKRDTVRGQLKGIFRKLDINRQSDIVRLVDRLGRFGPG